MTQENQELDTQKARFYHGMTAKLLLFFLILSLIPLIASAIISYQQNYARLRAQITEEMSRTVAQQGDYYDTWAAERMADIQTLANIEDVRRMDPEVSRALVKQFKADYKVFEGIAILNPEGKTFVDADDRDIDLHERDYFKKGMEGEASFSDPLISKATGEVAMIIAAPVIKDEQVVGVAFGSVPVKEMSNFINKSRRGETGEIYVVTNQGLMMTASRFEEQMKAAGLIKERSELEMKVDTVGSQEALAGNTGVSEYTNYLGKHVIGAYRPIANGNLAMLMEQETSEAFIELESLRNTAIAVVLVSILIVVLVAIFVARGVTAPLRQLTTVAGLLAQGKLAREMDETLTGLVSRNRDEIGELGQGYLAMLGYLRNVADASKGVAQGDLRSDFTALSEEDEIGSAVSRMITDLRGLAGEIQHNATDMDEATRGLETAAVQAAEATGQITTTLVEIAEGLSQQANDVNKTATSADQMERAIDGVAKGAQEQAEAVADASRIMTQLSEAFVGVRQGAVEQSVQMEAASTARESMEQAIGNVVSASGQVAEEAERSAGTARQGMKMAEMISQSVQKVRDVSEQLSTRINDLGKRSAQIGAIVETIDDIAAQTNLLALNAAIEAARAGEHGKGFSVVADEVRKLAERSSIATKEIAEMVHATQLGAREAVDTMEQTIADVEAAVGMTDQARESFEGIAAGTQASVERVAGINTALEDMRMAAAQLGDVIVKAAEVSERNRNTAEAMGKLANDMTASLDTVSAIVEENTASTEEMAAFSTDVTHTIENIASVAEENSAAMEEVSASTEEINAQVDEVGSSARHLSALSERMMETARRFQI